MSLNQSEDALIARYLALSTSRSVGGEVRTAAEQALIDSYVAMHRNEGAPVSRRSSIETQIDRYVAMASGIGQA